MPKVSDDYKDERRDVIVEAAYRCVVERGFAQTSMTHIIRESGVSAGAIYNLFENKHEIAIAVAHRAINNRLDSAPEYSEAFATMSPLEILEFSLQALSADPVTSRILLQIWASATTDESLLLVVRRDLDLISEVYRGRLGEWVRQNKRLTDAEATEWATSTAEALRALLIAFVTQLAIMPDFSVEAYLEFARTSLPS